MIGQTLDHYRIESKLGEGGMGVVYKARDLRLNRLVATKVLPPEVIADPVRKERFVREARATSALNHPNIVTIYDIHSEGGFDFIVMEYIKGKTLGELISSKGMPEAHALRYAVQIADALATAHGAGILHRDIKPSNVMLTEEGRVKILDFGLAKLTEPVASSPEAATPPPSLTEEGAVVGTPAYMSPEQAQAHKLDARSDIFSFGAVLYEMVTGRRAFPDDHRLTILYRILHEDPLPPRQLAAISSELEKLILRCLRKDPARRFQTMADLKVALEDLREEPNTSRQVRAPTRRHWAWAAGLLAIGVVALLGLFAWPARRTPHDAQLLRATALTTFSGVERYPSLSPDGDHVVFTWNGFKRDNQDIYVQLIGSGAPLRLTTDPANDYNPVWSPDGRWIAFLRGESTGPLSQSVYELRLIPPLGGPERKLADIRVREVTYYSPMYLAWCPDGSCLVVTDSPGEGKPDALFVISLETGEKRPLTSSEAPVLADTSPAVSPDGRWLVFHRIIAMGTGELYLLPLGKDLTAAGEPRRLTLTAENAEYPTWMPDGKEILYSAKGSLWRLAVSGDEAAERLPFVGEDGLMPVVSRTQAEQPARLVYARSFTDENIWRIDTSAPGAPSSAPPVLAIASTRFDSHPRFSPDGRRVVFASTRSGAWELWISDPDGAGAVQLTSMGARATGAPKWSHDGEWIAFASDQAGEFDVYVVSAAGGRPRRLTSHPAFDHSPAFSRDGSGIYFVSERTGRYEIWRMPAEGGDPIQITRDGGWAVFDAPGGAAIYYIDLPVEGATVWRLPLPGGEPVKVLDGIVWWNFEMHEEGIFYIDRADGETHLRFFDFATGESATVARDLGDVRCCVTATPDGRTILYVREDASVDDLMLVENFQ